MDLLTSLPPEILPTIFGFLPVEDRKNMRLTCQLFRHACDRPSIVSREKFVFRFGFVVGSHSAKYIRSCVPLRSTVEFRAVDLTRLPLNIWEKFGDRITSLFVDNCPVNDEIIVEIFLRCSELVEIYLNVSAETEPFFGEIEQFAGESTPLDKLIALRTERPKLRSFKLFTSRSLSDCFFRKIFRIFPNIQTFGRDRYYPSSYDSSPFRFRRDQRSAPIELPPSVEHFIYNMNANSSWMVPYIRHPTIKFKKLEFTLQIFNDQGMCNITEFFSSQTEVERLDLRILARRCRPNLVKTILLHILEKLRKLEALKFDVNCEMEFSDLELATLVATIRNLKSLDLRFMRSEDNPWISRHELPSTEYSRLVHLKLNFGSINVTELQSVILSRCRSLQSLSLRNVDDRTMKLILRDHTELKELSLDCLNWGEISCMEKYSFDRLRKLEYLDLRSVAPHSSWKPAESAPLVPLVSKLDCPKLKVFLYEEPRLSKKDTIKVLQTLAQRTPQLETLSLSSVLPIEEYHVHCRSFRKLRYFVRKRRYNDNSFPAETDFCYQQLFEACPSLTYIVKDQDRESRALFYDRRTGSLLSHYDISAELLCKTLNIPAYKY